MLILHLCLFSIDRILIPCQRAEECDWDGELNFGIKNRQKEKDKTDTHTHTDTQTQNACLAILIGHFKNLQDIPV